jgi:hypothetical protein
MDVDRLKVFFGQVGGGAAADDVIGHGSGLLSI